MAIHDCDAPLRRRLTKIDRAWFMQLENTSATDTLTNLHVVHVYFREGEAEGVPTVRIEFEDVPTLASQTTVILKHTTLLFDSYTSKWGPVGEGADRLIMLSEASAPGPIEFEVQFVRGDQNCSQELGAGKGSDLSLNRES
jgi:hypothetical protein